ncbi:MAG: PAS domain-containing protein [Chitinivibrionales bacterium]|nr:PAS domain-containing protein [Chitinivibrionales bacterium]
MIVGNAATETAALEKLNLALEAGKAGSWDWNMVDNTYSWSNQFVALFGIGSMANPTFQTWIDMLHPQDREGAMKKIQDAVATRTDLENEYRIILPDNTVRWIRAVGKVFYDKDVPQRMVGLCYDISERKKAEKALRESEERYRALFDGIDNGVAVYDVIDNGEDFILRDFNRAGELNDNTRREQLIGKHVLDIYPKMKSIGMIEMMQRVWKTGLPLHYPVSRFQDQQLLLWYENYIYKLPSGELVVVFENCTGRKRLELALQKSEETHRALVEGLPDIIIRMERSGRHLFVSENVKEFFTLTAENFIGKTLFELGFPHGVCQKLDAAVAAVFESGKPRETEFSLELDQPGPEDGTPEISVRNLRYASSFLGRKQGLTIFNCRLMPEYGPKGDKQVCSVLSICRDVTGLKKMQEEIQRGQKLESLGLLAGGIAHDFNNLLGGIFGYIDMARECTNDTRSSIYLSKALSTIDRARGLTQQLLTFAKGGAPILAIDNLFPYVQECAQFALSGSNVTCKVTVQEKLWPCSFDKNQIGQVIDNIIINALQAMPMGGTIEICASNCSLDEHQRPHRCKGNFVKISIKDSGIGIPEEMLSRIFDPFFTTKTKGHGLGLSTCYSIITRHGGCIEVDSIPGKGSTFHFYLPAGTDAVVTPQAEVELTHKGSGTFLVMDDEEVMRETIKEMLKSFGYSVVCTENSTETLEFIKSEKRADRKLSGMIFDLTIAGGIGGKETVAEVRKICKTIAVFVVSGYADDPVIAEPTRFGFTASICKPFRKMELAKMLNLHMNKGMVK